MNLRFTKLSGLSIFLASLFCTVQTYGQNEKGYDVVEQNDQLTRISFKNPSFSQKAVDVNGVEMSKIVTSEGSHMLIEGMPDIPKYSQSIVIPNKGKTSVEVVHSGFYDIENVTIAPSKGNITRNINPADVAYKFGEVYKVNDFYPGKLADLSDPFILRNYRGQTITTYPFQYNPVTKTLRVYENLEVRVVNNAKEAGLNELTETTSQTSTTYDEIYSRQFLNYGEIKKNLSSEDGEEGTMLIIGPEKFSAEIDRIVKWKNERGISCEWKDVSTIGVSDTKVLSYVKEYYESHKDLVYLLLVGDHADVPSHTYGKTSQSEQLWSDSYYGQLSGTDYYPEVFVGRLSAENAGQLKTMVDRQMEYEVTPMEGDHYGKALGLGSSEGKGQGDEGEIDYEHLRNIRTELMDFGMTKVHEFYQGSQGGEDAAGEPRASSIVEALNEGVTLFNYTGHGSLNTMITGNFKSSDIQKATNNGKYPFVISVACNNGEFAGKTCIAEAFQRASSGGEGGPTGSIAAAGSSILMSWAPPMETQDEMSKILTEQYADKKKTSLGGLFYNGQMSVLEDYPGKSGHEVLQTWVFFGDPSVTMRTTNPMKMVVDHTSETGKGASELTVDCDIEGANISIAQNGVFLGSAKSMGGSTKVTFDALTSEDDLVVTATKYNYIPYQGAVKIGDATGIKENSAAQLQDVYPIPADDRVNLALNLLGSSNIAVKITDLAGKVVLDQAVKRTAVGKQILTISTSGIKTGVYFMNVTINGNTSVEKIAIGR